MGTNFLIKMVNIHFRKYCFSIIFKIDAFKFIKIDINLNGNESEWLLINEERYMMRRSLNKLLSTKVLVKLRLSRGNIIKVYNIVSSVSPAAIVNNRTTSQKYLCLLKFTENNNYSINDSPRELLKVTLNAFLNNNIQILKNYNALR